MLVRANTVIIVLVSLALLPGCMTFTVSGNASETTESEKGPKTIHGSIYEFRWKEFKAQKCNEGALAKVEFHTNALLLTASFLSLGLYVPQTVEWWCEDTLLDTDGGEAEPDPANESKSWTPPPGTAGASAE